jgi:hypothetical protein
MADEAENFDGQFCLDELSRVSSMQDELVGEVL